MRAIGRLLVVGLLVCPAAGWAQSPPAGRARLEEAAQLLARSPLLQERGGMAADARFVREARGVVGGEGELATAEDATRALEAFLSGTAVRAIVQSSPGPIVVSYRRLVDEAAPELSVTTDDTLALQPALYLFTATDPRTGKVERQRKACATGCTVVFRFR